MQVVHTNCAGLDVHKRTVTACVIVPNPAGGWNQSIRTFETHTHSLLEMLDWLLSFGCTTVAMESTGEYWRPVFNILESSTEVILVNAHHVKNVPGRKTDVKDAAWLAELLQHGLLKPSFIPPKAQRDLRDLIRHRQNFVRERTNLVNRIQKVLEAANIKLASVATDIMGVSGRAMLKALIASEKTPAQIADLAVGRLRNKHEQLEKALVGRIQPHHRFILNQLLSSVESIDEVIKQFDAQIEEYIRPFEQAVELLDTIPGVALKAAQAIVSEIGTDMSRFKSAAHLAAWAGLAPGNCESAGKRLSSFSRKGNRTLKTILVQAAWATSRTNTYLAAQFRRISARRGAKRAAVAVAHSILVIAYHLISRSEPYSDLGVSHFERQEKPEVKKKRLIRQLEQLGFQVHVTEIAVAS
jgi:transposase